VSIEPERRLVRAVNPWAIPAFAVAFVAALILGGTDAAWSAAIGVAVVFANLNAYGRSLAWAARISPTMMFAVAMGGYVLRLALVVVVLLLLDRLAFFSPLAFGLAVLPSTLFVLAYELRLLSGRFTSELWNLPPAEERPAS
jgi:drug/metabolite transporter (DMT)-like permease